MRCVVTDIAAAAAAVAMFIRQRHFNGIVGENIYSTLSGAKCVAVCARVSLSHSLIVHAYVYKTAYNLYSIYLYMNTYSLHCI